MSTIIVSAQALSEGVQPLLGETASLTPVQEPSVCKSVWSVLPVQMLGDLPSPIPEEPSHQGTLPPTSPQTPQPHPSAERSLEAKAARRLAQALQHSELGIPFFFLLVPVRAQLSMVDGRFCTSIPHLLDPTVRPRLHHSCTTAHVSPSSASALRSRLLASCHELPATQ